MNLKLGLSLLLLLISAQLSAAVIDNCGEYTFDGVIECSSKTQACFLINNKNSNSESQVQIPFSATNISKAGLWIKGRVEVIKVDPAVKGQINFLELRTKPIEELPKKIKESKCTS